MSDEVCEFSGSSFIRRAEYEPDTSALVLYFTDGEVFGYAGVPKETYLEMIRSKSVGGFFHRHIKGRYPHQNIIKDTTDDTGYFAQEGSDINLRIHSEN